MIAASLRARLRLQASLLPGLGRVAHLEAPLYAAAQSHFATKRWEGNCPLTPPNDTYSAELYGELAHATLMEYDETAQDAPPLFCARRRPSLLRCWFGGRRLCPTSWLSSGLNLVAPSPYRSLCLMHVSAVCAVLTGCCPSAISLPPLAECTRPLPSASGLVGRRAARNARRDRRRAG